MRSLAELGEGRAAHVSGGMPVRYHPAFAVLMIVAGLFIGGTSVLTGALLLAGLGCLPLLIGIGYAIQPWFVVHERSTEIKNLFGMTMKTGVDFWTSGAPPAATIIGQPRTSDSDLARFIAHEWTATIVVFTKREPDLFESFYVSVGRYWRPRLRVTITAAGYERRF